MARIISIKTLKEKRFHHIPTLDARWTEMLGTPERNFKMAIVGPSTSGKSSFALELADQLAKKIGKVLLNSYEEGLNATIQIRAKERGVDAPKLYIADRMEFDELMIKIKKNHYRIIIIDSVKFMQLSKSQYKTLIQTFKTKAFIFIGHGNTEGQMEDAKDIWKDADIKVFIAYGKAKITSRYSGETKEFTLFTTKKINPKPSQGQLL